MDAGSDGSHLAGDDAAHRVRGGAHPARDPAPHLEDAAPPTDGTGAHHAGRAPGHRNVIDGPVTLSGMTVQAGEVHGGIHAHLPPPSRPVPRQLPPVSRHFTDRESDIRALGELHDRRTGSAPPLIVVTGPAGVGKTTLVTQWLSGLTEEYPDGHFYADLRGHTAQSAASPGEVLGQFLRAVGAPPAAGPAEQVALWRSATARLRIAVLLDNAFTAAQVRSLLPSGADSLVAVTCRQRLTGLRTDGADVHELGSLPPDAATELLRHGLGAERIQQDSASAARVVALCAGLPLALCLVSARLAARPEQPVRAMADALASDQERLTVLKVEGERAVRGVLDESYAGLSAPVAQLYRALGVLPVLAFDIRLAAAVCDVPQAEAEARLEALAEANLLEDHGASGYRFHDLVRLHAAERACDAADAAAREATVRRAFDVRLAAVAEAERLLVPARRPLAREHAAPPGLVPRFESPPAALAWLDAQRLDLMRLVREAAAREWHDAVWQLVDSMWPLFLRLRHYDDWTEAHQLGLTAARYARDATAERQMLTSGAAGLTSVGRLPEAIEWYQLALESARVTGAQRAYGQALLGIGACMYESGRGPEGGPALREAIEVWEGIGYVRGAALARIVLGEIALEREDPAAAVEHFSHAHRTLGTVDDPHDEARALAFLGFAHGRAGEVRAGTDELSRALAVFTGAGSAHWQGRAWRCWASWRRPSRTPRPRASGTSGGSRPGRASARATRRGCATGSAAFLVRRGRTNPRPPTARSDQAIQAARLAPEGRQNPDGRHLRRTGQAARRDPPVQTRRQQPGTGGRAEPQRRTRPRGSRPHPARTGQGHEGAAGVLRQQTPGQGQQRAPGPGAVPEQDVGAVQQPAGSVPVHIQCEVQPPLDRPALPRRAPPPRSARPPLGVRLPQDALAAEADDRRGDEPVGQRLRDGQCETRAPAPVRTLAAQPRPRPCRSLGAPPWCAPGRLPPAHADTSPCSSASPSRIGGGIGSGRVSAG